MNETPRHRYWRWFFTLLLTLLGVLAAFFVLPKVLVFFLPVLIAWLVTWLSAPLIRFLKDRLHLKARLSSTLVLILLLLAVLGILVGIGQLLVRELLGFLPKIPDYMQTVSSAVDTFEQWLGRVVQHIPNALISSVDQVEQKISDTVLSLGTVAGRFVTDKIADLAISIPRILINLVITILLIFFMLNEREELKQKLQTRLPAGIKDFLRQCRAALKKALNGYLITQLKLSWIVAVILLAGFLIMRMPYAFLLSLLVAFVDFLPVFGSGTVLLPWALVELLSKDYWTMAGLLVLYGLTQGIKQFLSPKMMGDSVGFPPLASVFCLLVGFKLWGIGGMIFAIPLGMLVVEIYNMGIFSPAISCIREMITALAELLKKPKEDPAERFYDQEPEGSRKKSPERLPEWEAGEAAEKLSEEPGEREADGEAQELPADAPAAGDERA